MPFRRKVKASYTVEAAVVFPVFICFAVTLIFLLRVLSVQAAIGRAMDDTVREMAVILQKKDKTRETLNALVIGDCMARIHKEGVRPQAIVGGIPGILFLGSEVTETDIHLVCSYRIRYPTGLFGRVGLKMHQEAVQRRWVGWNPSMEDQEETYCYITPNGEAYHMRTDCPYLKPSVRAVPIAGLKAERNKDREIYDPCPYCKGSRGGTCYLTDYGTSYHFKKTCPGLRRTIRSILKEKAVEKGYHACPKCGTGGKG